MSDDKDTVVEAPQVDAPTTFEYPGMIGTTVKELKHLVNLAQINSDAVGIDHAAQKLSDQLRGCYGDDVADMFTLPTIDNLVAMNVCEVVDWDRGTGLNNKVKSYLALAEDFGLTEAMVTDLEDLTEEWKLAQPVQDRIHKPRTTEGSKQQPDIPFAISVSYKGTEVGKFGTRAGETYWSQTWSKVKRDHYQGVLNLGDWSDAIKAGIADAKAGLLAGAQSVQAWDYVVTRLDK